MMARNEFSIMKERVTSAAHDDSLTALAGDWINETINDMHRETDFKYLYVTDTFTSVAGQIEYNYTAMSSVSSNDQVDAIISIRDTTNDYYIYPVDSSYAYQADPDPTDTTNAIPTFYYTKNRLIGLLRAPGGAYTYSVDYKKFATDLSADSDTPDLPLAWTDIILMGAEWKALKYLKRQDWANCFQLYRSELQRAVVKSDRHKTLRHSRPGARPSLRTPYIEV